MLCFLFISLLCFNFVPFTRTWHLCPPNNETMIYSCSDQLWSDNTTEDACQIKRYDLDSPDCYLKLPENPKKNIPQRGIIKIEPFAPDIPGERRTVFKITAHNITWNNLKIRFHQQNNIYCMKREFFINKSVPNNKTLIYDCPWSTASFEDKLIDFEYTYGVNKIYDGKRTFVIHVPKYETLNSFKSSYLHNVKFFNYVETTNLYQLILKIHAAANVNVPSYEIYVDLTKNNFTTSNGPFFRVPDNRMDILGVTDFEYATYGRPGEYVFRVRPQDCAQCPFSVSPVVIIPENSTIITIGIVGISCLIPILMITLYMYLKVDSGLTPRVLLVTTPANDAHKTICKSLANLLKQYNITTMVDIIDIPIINTVPSLWLTESFEYATHVIILISDNKPVTNIYRNIDNLLNSLIQRNPNKICCSLKFSFSQNIHLKHVHRSFKLMQDYNAFINFIHNRGFLHRLIKKVMRNDLYYDLVKQINNYEMNITPTLPSYCSDTCVDYYNDELNQNEQNQNMSLVVLVEEQEELPQGVPEIVYECLNEVELNLNKCGDNLTEEDVSDAETIDSLIQSCLEEVSYRNETTN